MAIISSRHNLAPEKQQDQEETNHFKRESCGSTFISKPVSMKHNNTKHQFSQKLQEETKCPVCGKAFRNGPKDLDMMYHLSEHVEADNIKYGEKYKKPLEWKLC